ncbi:MAG: glycosyltransferase family 1 protein, partial [Sphingobacteriales bacterium]
IIHRLKVQQACKEAQQIIAISEQTRNDLIHFLKIPADKISVIYQGCHTAFKADYSEAEKDAVRKKFALPPAFILNVGTIEERKNLLTVVKSLLHHSLPLVVVGRDTAYKKTIDAFIAEHKLGSRVQFLKNVNMAELAIIYQEASVFCYPSVFEGFGIPIIESLYSKTPVITSKGGCFPEAGGPGSFYIDSFDERALAGIVIRLQEEDELRLATIHNGFEYAQRFNDENVGNQIYKLYQELTANSKISN